MGKTPRDKYITTPLYFIVVFPPLEPRFSQACVDNLSLIPITEHTKRRQEQHCQYGNHPKAHPKRLERV